MHDAVADTIAELLLGIDTVEDMTDEGVQKSKERILSVKSNVDSNKTQGLICNPDFRRKCRVA